jgi:hypothetical protein
MLSTASRKYRAGKAVTVTLRADFVEALRRLAGAFDAYAAKTGARPVLAGGAAASIYTGGMITSGDFDVIAAADEVFDGVMADHGFRPEDRAGHLLIGYYHPDVPTIGVQLVSGRLFEGRTDPQHITLLPIENGGTIALAPIEDMIADRLGQYAASDDRDDEMLEQATLLFKLAGHIDREYLIKRALEETGDPALLGLR